MAPNVADRGEEMNLKIVHGIEHPRFPSSPCHCPIFPSFHHSLALFLHLKMQPSPTGIYLPIEFFQINGLESPLQKLIINIFVLAHDLICRRAEWLHTPSASAQSWRFLYSGLFLYNLTQPKLNPGITAKAAS